MNETVEIAPGVFYNAGEVGTYRETPEQVQKAFGIRRSLMLLSNPDLFEPKWLAECVELGLPRFAWEAACSI